MREFRISIKIGKKLYSVRRLNSSQAVSTMPDIKCDFVSKDPVVDIKPGIEVKISIKHHGAQRQDRWLLVAISSSKHGCNYIYQLVLSSNLYRLKLINERIAFYHQSLGEVIERLSNLYLSNQISVCHDCNEIAKEKLLISRRGQSHFDFMRHIISKFNLVFVTRDLREVKWYCQHQFKINTTIDMTAACGKEVNASSGRKESHYKNIALTANVGDGYRNDALCSIEEFYLDDDGKGYQNQGVITDKKSFFYQENIDVITQSLEVEIKQNSSDDKSKCGVDFTFAVQEDLQVTRTLPIAGLHSEVCTLPLLSHSKGVMIFDERLDTEPLIVASLSGDKHFSDGDVVIQQHNYKLALSDDKSHLMIGGNDTCIDFSRKAKALDLKARNMLEIQSKEIDIKSNHHQSLADDVNIDAQKGDITFESDEKLSLILKDNSNVRAKKILTASDNELVLSAKKLKFHAKNGVTIRGDSLSLFSLSHLNIKAENISTNSDKPISIGTSNSRVTINSHGSFIKASHCSYPFLLVGNVAAMAKGDTNLHVVSSRVVPYKPPNIDGFLVSVDFLCFEKSVAMLHEDIKISFMIRNPFSRAIEIRVLILQCISKAKNPSLAPCRYSQDKENYYQFDSMKINVSAKFSGKKTLVWKLKVPPKYPKEECCYFRFQVVADGVLHSLLSNGLELFKKVYVEHKGFRDLSTVLIHRNKQYVIQKELGDKIIYPEGDQFSVDYIPLNGQSMLHLNCDSGALEVVDGNTDEVMEKYFFSLDSNSLTDHIEIQTLMTPIIVNFREDKCDQYLSHQELLYLSKRKQLVIFIHGFNISHGKFDCYDNGDVITVKHESKSPTGAHYWLTQVESHMNQSQQLSVSSPSYHRLLVVSWPGDAGLAIDYINAVHTSYQLGARLKQLVDEVIQFDNDIEVNIIAHSQGNALVLSALREMVKAQTSYHIANIVFWQPALPYDSFSASLLAGEDVLSVVNNTLVLHSKNDNVLGKIEGIADSRYNLSEILNDKPLFELVAGVFFTYLGFGSLYQLATWLDCPAQFLLSDADIDNAWRLWRQSHPDVLADDDGCELQYTLSQQLVAYHHCGVLTKITDELSKNLLENRVKINAMLKHVSKTIAHVVIRGIYILLTHLDTFVHLVERYTLNEGLCSDVEHPLPLIFKMACFSHVLLNTSALNKRYAMGWYGIDEKSKQYYGEKLRALDISDTYYHHSALLNLNDDKRQQLYGDIVFNPINGICLKQLT